MHKVSVLSMQPHNRSSTVPQGYNVCGGGGAICTETRPLDMYAGSQHTGVVLLCPYNVSDILVQRRPLCIDVSSCFHSCPSPHLR
jgi:hypothetical protein